MASCPSAAGRQFERCRESRACAPNSGGQEDAALFGDDAEIGRIDEAEIGGDAVARGGVAGERNLDDWSDITAGGEQRNPRLRSPEREPALHHLTGSPVGRHVGGEVQLRLPRRVADAAQDQVATGRKRGRRITEDEDRTAVGNRRRRRERIRRKQGGAERYACGTLGETQIHAADRRRSDGQRAAHVGQGAEQVTSGQSGLRDIAEVDRVERAADLQAQRAAAWSARPSRRPARGRCWRRPHRWLSLSSCCPPAPGSRLHCRRPRWSHCRRPARRSR